MSAASSLMAFILACAPHVAPSTIQSIIDVESSGNWLAIGVNRGDKLRRQPRDVAEAVAWARWLQTNGRNFDAGLMQINVNNWSKLGLTPENVFDPCTNIRAGARVLTEDYARSVRTHGHGQRALQVALSRYNTGNPDRGFANGYVGKVTAAASRRAGMPVPVLAPVARSTNTNSPSMSTGVAPAAAWSSPGAWGEIAHAGNSIDTSAQELSR